MRALTFLIIFILIPGELSAKVIDQSSNGFTIQIERIVSVDSSKAYQQFLNVSQWWDDDHTYFGKSENLSIDATAGGCFCEIDGENQVLHMTVSYVDPNKKLHMIGGLGPLQMMGVSGGMVWEFKTLGEGKSKIIHRYQVSGYSKDGLEKLAPIVDKVQSLQVDSLINRLTAKE